MILDLFTGARLAWIISRLGLYAPLRRGIALNGSDKKGAVFEVWMRDRVDGL